jgi:hypothetical protein
MPLSALLIPVALSVIHESEHDRTQRPLASIAFLVIFLSVFYSLNALYRKGGPYSTAVSQCIYNRACTPFALAKVITHRYALKPMLDQAANPNFFEPSGLASQAVGLIERYSPDRRAIPLFLGIHPASIWSVHTNAVLVLLDKGHRWPISYVLSDEINPAVRSKIIGADVKLEEGETIFIRSDESRLGPLESALVAKVRAEVLLCELPGEAAMVKAYRASFRQSCSENVR